MKTKTFLLGVLVGGVAAGVTTLLSTPQSGKKLRNQLQASKEQVISQSRELLKDFNALTSDIKTVAAEGKDVITNVASDLKDSVAKYKTEATLHQQKIASEIEGIQNQFTLLSNQLPKK